MERMDEWEAHFNSPEAQFDVAEKATHRAIHLQRGGCYDELLAVPVAERDSLFCIEFFPVGNRLSPEQILSYHQARAEPKTKARLNFVLRRIGRLGPDPGGIAVWSFADYRALEPFERSRDEDHPLRPTEVGVYRWFGKEIL